MFRLAHAFVALLMASPLLAARLRDGRYKISYSPAPCSIETKHYLELSSPTAEATFDPTSEDQAQVWEVTTHPSDSTVRELHSVKYPGYLLAYPRAEREIRVRGLSETSEEVVSSDFNIIDVAKDGYYYVYPMDHRDMVLNGDTRIDPKLRWAYFRGNITERDDSFPLPMLPLEFTRVADVSVSSSV